MTTRLATRCRAKINLTLRVLGRRADGYHELESLVAFAAVGDLLTLEPAGKLSLTVGGPFGEGLASGSDNLVLKAARALSARVEGLRGGCFHLVKRLPLASGIGGGSADAAGALRLLARINGLAPDDARLIEAAQETGSDVPVCLESRARVMSGAGERLGPILDLPPLFAVLANPGVAVETRSVFAALGLAPGESGPGQGAPTPAATLDGIVSGTNDLARPARHVAPIVGEVLDALGTQPGCRLARMSGSGATCFAIFDDCRTSAAAAKAIASEHPGWWIRPTQLG